MEGIGTGLPRGGTEEITNTVGAFPGGTGKEAELGAAPLGTVPPGKPAPPEGGASLLTASAGVEGPEKGHVPDSPEGYLFPAIAEGAADTEALSRFTAVAHAHGVSQGQAEAMVEMYASLVAGKQAEAEKRALSMEQGWLSDLKKQGDFAQTVHHARLAVERFGTPELGALLDETRLGSHPALVRFVASIGRELAEPSALPGRTGKTGGRLNFYETME